MFSVLLLFMILNSHQLSPNFLVFSDLNFFYCHVGFQTQMFVQTMIEALAGIGCVLDGHEP